MDEIIAVMTEQQARQITEEIRKTGNSLRSLLNEADSGKAWAVLGYDTMNSYILNEFPEFSKGALYRELQAARTESLLEVPIGTYRESTIRPLARNEFINNPTELNSVWEQVVATAPEGKITAAHVQAVVDEVKGSDIAKAKQAMQITTYSHQSLEYYTPKWVIDAAREVMGWIDLDPASCKEAQENVQAVLYYTIVDDGLSRDWYGKVWMNPPYSKTDGRSNQDIWTEHLISEYENSNVTEAIFLVKAALGYKWFESLFERFPVCFLRERLSFILDDGNDDGQSKQGTAIFYLGDNFDKFYAVFRKYGRVIPSAEVLDESLFRQ